MEGIRTTDIETPADLAAPIEQRAALQAPTPTSECQRVCGERPSASADGFQQLRAPSGGSKVAKRVSEGEKYCASALNEG
ncbi:hypothetical protein V1294_006277 [Bradyrhizobium sp. AZCC 1678]|uniref:hypothetical protein n=1 Tax=Bradyrhizobium sp. AZCC 1678 TaxID=3117030 RepID=UPI002FF32516